MAAKAGTAYYDIPEGALVAGAPISIPLLETERDKEDKEIVQTVERLAFEKRFSIGEVGALLYVLQVDTKAWPQFTRYAKEDPDHLPKEFQKADAFGKASGWLIGKHYLTDVKDGTDEGELLFKARVIAWAQSFVSRSTSRNFQDTVDNNALKEYPSYMESFQPESARKYFLPFYNPPPIEPPEEKSDGRGSGGSGGMGFLIGAVIILLLALGLLTYFLLR